MVRSWTDFFKDLPDDIQKMIDKFAGYDIKQKEKITKELKNIYETDTRIPQDVGEETKLRTAFGCLLPNYISSKEQGEKQTIYRTRVMNEGILYEQIQPGIFVGLKDGEIDEHRAFEDEHYIIEPMDIDKELGDMPIKFPLKPQEYDTKTSLFKEIREHIAKYVTVSEDFLDICALYIMITWVTKNLNTVPYLKVFGQVDSGKSRWLDVIGDLCWKRVTSGGATNPAPIFRTLDIVNDATFSLDEASMKGSDMYSAIAQILNTGWQRNHPVIRCVGRDYKPHAFPSFGPKLIATRNQFFGDEAVDRRCIAEKIRNDSNLPTELPPEYDNESSKLRNKLLMFELKNWDKLERTKIDSMNLKGISSGSRQVFSAFAAVFHDEPKILEKIREYTKKFDLNQTKKMGHSLHGQIVYAICELNRGGLKEIERNDETLINITAGDIGDAMKKMGMIGNYDVQRIGNILSNTLHLTRKCRSIDGSTRKIIIKNEEDLNELKNRYLTEKDREKFSKKREEPKPLELVYADEVII
jgi:hypothetical protein